MKAKPSKTRSQQGYLLLSVMLLITVMLIAMAVEVPRLAQQIKRGKEEELINRGMEYAKAVKKYRRKMGAFPNSIEQLENTNHIRFLRKRYKDPMTGEDDWKLVHVGEAEIPLPQGNNPGLPGSGTPGLQGGTFTNRSGSGSTAGGLGGGTGLSGGTGLGGGTTPTGQAGLVGGPQPTGTPPAGTGQLGSLTTSNIGTGQQIGGGAVIGVVSTSKKSGIKEFHDSSEYNEWLFVYDPRLEQAAGPNGGGNAGITVAAPRAGGGAGGPVQGGQNPGTPGATPAPSPLTSR